MIMQWKSDFKLLIALLSDICYRGGAVKSYKNYF